MREIHAYRVRCESPDAQRQAGRYHPARVAELHLTPPAPPVLLTLGAGGGDAIHIYQDGARLYVLAINRRLEYCGVTEYDAATGAELGDVFLQADHAIREALGRRGLDLAPRTIARRLVEHLTD